MNNTLFLTRFQDLSCLLQLNYIKNIERERERDELRVEPLNLLVGIDSSKTDLMLWVVKHDSYLNQGAGIIFQSHCLCLSKARQQNELNQWLIFSTIKIYKEQWKSHFHFHEQFQYILYSLDIAKIKNLKLFCTYMHIISTWTQSSLFPHGTSWNRIIQYVNLNMDTQSVSP